jgi:hypothetical protein
MSSTYENYKIKKRLQARNKLLKFINDKGISRAQLIAFLNDQKQKVLKSESDEDIINRILKEFSLSIDYVLEALAGMKKFKIKTKATYDIENMDLGMLTPVHKDDVEFKKVKGDFKKLVTEDNHKKVSDKVSSTKTFKVLSSHQQKAFVKDGIHSIVNTRYNIMPIPFTINNAEFITTGCLNLLKKSKTKAKEKHEGGFNIYIKLLLNDVVFDDDSQPTKYTSFVIRGNHVYYADIYNKVFTEASKMYDTPTYCLTLHALDIVISPLAVKGGCNPTKCYKSDQVQKSKHEKIKLKSLPSSNNNCLFACVNYWFEIPGNKMKPGTVRRDLSFPPNTPINFKLIPQVIDYFHKKLNKSHGYHVVNELNQTMLFQDAEVTVNIYLRGEHYYIWEPINFKSVKHVEECYVTKTMIISVLNKG